MKFIKRYWGWILGIALFFVLLFPSLSWTRNNVRALEKQHNSQLSSLIMIPGSSATENRFDRLVAKLNQNNSRPHSLLKVKVMNDDSLHFTRQIWRGDNEPIIVVGFENNKDGYSNIKQQARRFNIAFKKLTEIYNFNNFKGIGHSNGGLIYTTFVDIFIKALLNHLQRFRFLVQMLSIQVCRRMSRL